MRILRLSDTHDLFLSIIIAWVVIAVVFIGEYLAYQNVAKGSLYRVKNRFTCFNSFCFLFTLCYFILTLKAGHKKYIFGKICPHDELLIRHGLVLNLFYYQGFEPFDEQ